MRSDVRIEVKPKRHILLSFRRMSYLPVQSLDCVIMAICMQFLKAMIQLSPFFHIFIYQWQWSDLFVMLGVVVMILSLDTNYDFGWVVLSSPLVVVYIRSMIEFFSFCIEGKCASEKVESFFLFSFRWGSCQWEWWNRL